MKSRLFRILALTASGWLAGVVARPAALVLTPIPESEPNNTPATADPLVLAGGCQAASGAISPTGDLDYYSFTAAAGAKVWALVDTGPSTTTRDSILTLFGPDGTTVLEIDDDDALGNDCDATIESQQASAIAGRTLTAGGTYFLRVQHFDGTATISAYKLVVVVTTTSTAESEPNDTAGTANPLVTSVSSIGVRTAAIGTVGDVDFYSVTVTAPATLFISADADPERNGGTDIVVDLIQPNGSTVLLSVDNSDNVGFPPPPAESFCFTITTPGTYFVRVTGFNSSTKMTTGTYALMVAACGLPTTPTPTPTRTLTPTVTATTVVGGPTATPTPTATATATGGPATVTPMPTFTPLGGIAPGNIPTLSFPMLLLMGLALIASAFVLVRRL
jgi:hypothetical protein